MPQVDSVFQTFYSWQTVLFCLGIAMTTYFVRTLVEALWKGASRSDLWNEVGVRLGPIATGALMALGKNFPWPNQLVGSRLAMVFYGGACGVASAYVYAAFKSWLTVAGKKGFKPAHRLMPKKFPKHVPAASVPDRPADPPKA